MPEVEKRYYHIGEVAKHFNVKTSLIRFWENQFDILRPKKNKNLLNVVVLSEKVRNISET